MNGPDRPDYGQPRHGRPERHGLFRLHPGPHDVYDHVDVVADIVAIHGLGGHPFDTWTDKDGHLWLRDSLPARIPKVRVMTFGYDSAVVFGSSRSTINDFAIDLATRLELERRRVEERQRPLVFICHSLGGVVFKEFLVHVSLQLDRCRDLLRSISGVVFMGTPHRGSRAATPAGMLSRIINAATFGSAIRSDLIRTLHVSSVELETISRHATELLKGLSIVSFYEQKPIGPTMIVEPFSAILGLPNERAVPIDADHREIARVSPRKEQRYLPVWTSLGDLVQAASSTQAEINRELLSKLFVDYKVTQLRPSRPQAGTCNWLFSHPTYVSWLDSRQSSMLLLTGKAGTGKSVLTRHLVESILSGSQNEAAGTAYLAVSFFCSYDEAALATEEAVLRALLHQLIQQNSQSANIVRSQLTKSTATGLTVSLQAEDLWASLVDVLSMSTMRRVFIAVDAIEELGLETAVVILSGLWRTAQVLNDEQPESRLRIFVSSRHHPAYASALPNLTILHMSRPQIQSDIEQYLHSAIDTFAVENGSFGASAPPSTRKEIVAGISARVDGMFLQASLMWEDFRRGILWNRDVVAQKLRRLNALPPGITALYDRVMDGMDEAIKDDALVIFSIMAAAARPLSEPELGAVLGIYHSSRPITRSTDFEPFRDLYRIMEQHFHDLVTIQDDNKVTFVHLSFMEYLQQRQDFGDILLSGRRKITRACLKYLKLRDMLQDASDGSDTAELFSKFPFLQYARDNFLLHICSIPYEDSLWLLFADTAGKFSVYTLGNLRSGTTDLCLSPLMAVLEHVPAPAKSQLIRQFKEHGYDLDERWSHRSCGRPLQYCCSLAGKDASLKEAAFLLLRLGANPSLPLRPWRSNLRRAMESGVWDLYEALLAHPLTNPNAPDERDQGILHALVREGPYERIAEVVDVLFDVDVNIQDCDGYTPLHIATYRGRARVVRKLLNVPGIRLDLPDKQGRTPLTLATYWGMKSIALVLIEHSQAFPLPEDAEQLSPLVLAAQHGHRDLCLQLLDRARYRNLDFHIDLSGRSILHHAAINNWADLLATCLTHSNNDPNSNTNVNKLDHAGKTPLHHAAALGNVEACTVLVSTGAASLVLQDRNGRTAPQAAADAGFKDALLVLLHTGRVDPNQRDVEGRNLVHWVATVDCVDILELLEDQGQSKGVPVEWARRDKHGKRPVDIAGLCGSKNVGLFLAARTPGWMADRPEWRFEEMYRSEEVEVVEGDELHWNGTVEARVAQRQKERADEEWEKARRRFPDDRYGVMRREKPDYPAYVPPEPVPRY